MVKCTTIIGPDERKALEEIFLRRVYKLSKKKTRIPRIVIGVCIGGGLLFYGLMDFLAGHRTSFFVLPLFFGLGYLCEFFVIDRINIVRGKKAFHKGVIEQLSKDGLNYDSLVKIEYVISNSGVNKKSEFSEFDCSWSEFVSCDISEKFILLYRKDSPTLVIDKETMTSEELEELYSLLRENNLYNVGENHGHDTWMVRNYNFFKAAF